MDSLGLAMLNHYTAPATQPMSVKEMVELGVITLKTAKKVYGYDPNAQPKKKFVFKSKA
jgi:hypothetical protein